MKEEGRRGEQREDPGEERADRVGEQKVQRRQEEEGQGERLGWGKTGDPEGTEVSEGTLEGGS